MSAKKKHPKMPACSACGVAWTDHLGIAGTCRKLDKARGALKVILTWSSFRDGEMLTAKDTMNLCRKVLKETAPNGRMRDGGQCPNVIGEARAESATSPHDQTL
jgi:hypothetical protein